MPPRLWGCYSVADHLVANALVADLVLYDRLVVPVPDGDEDRWERNGWEPERQAELLDAAHPFIEAIPWTRQRQEQSHRSVVNEMNRESDNVRPYGSYAWTRLTVGKDILNDVVEAQRGDGRAIAVYAAPDRFQREWSFTRSFPFARRTSTASPGALFEGVGPVPEDQEPVRIIAARLLVPVVGPHEISSVLRITDMLQDRDFAQRRAELHEVITEFQTQGEQSGGEEQRGLYVERAQGAHHSGQQTGGQHAQGLEAAGQAEDAGHHASSQGEWRRLLDEREPCGCQPHGGGAGGEQYGVHRESQGCQGQVPGQHADGRQSRPRSIRRALMSGRYTFVPHNASEP